MENHIRLVSNETKLSLGWGSQAKTHRGSSGQRLVAAELWALDGLRPSGREHAGLRGGSGRSPDLGWTTPLGGSSDLRRRWLEQVVRKPKTRFRHDRLKSRGPTSIKNINENSSWQEQLNRLLKTLVELENVAQDSIGRKAGQEKGPKDYKTSHLFITKEPTLELSTLEGRRR